MTLAQTSIDPADTKRQYTYLNCHELNYELTPNHEYPMRSNKLNADFWQAYCERIFPLSADERSDFGIATGSNIVFTNGSEDPWQWASMRVSFNGNDELKIVALMATCDNCSHKIDLKSQNSALQPEILEVQDQIADLISEWLATPDPLSLFMQ